MAIFQGMSGEAEDRIVNVFHFTSAATYEEMNPDCIAAVTDFYNGTNPTSTLSAYLSPWLNFPAEIRTYDMDLPKNTRVPSINAWERAFATNPTGLPEEVAACITLHAVVPPALNRRRRGRLYIGPLNASALAGGSNAGPSRPSGVFMNDAAAAAGRLVASGSSGPVWSILSKVPTENYVRIAAGYVDNAFDTQRRRGPDPTARVTFGFPSV